MSTTGGIKCGIDVPGIKAMMVHPICPPLVVSSVVLMCQGSRLWWCIQYVHHWWCQVWYWCARDQGYDGASNMSTTGGVKCGIDVPGIKAMMVHPICPPLVVSSVVLMCQGSRLWWCIQYVHHWWCQVWYWCARDQGYDGASNMSTTGSVKCGIDVPGIKAMMVHPICPPLVVSSVVLMCRGSRLWWCIQYVHHWWCQVWYWCAGDQGYDGASNMSTTGGVKYGVDVPESRLWWCIQYVHHWWCQVWYWCAGDQGYDGASNMSTTGGVKCGIDVPGIKAMMVHPICPPLVVSSVVLMCRRSRLWWCIQYVHHWWCQVWYWCARDQGYDGASNMSTTGGVKCGIDVPEIKAMMVHPICPPLVVSSVVLMCRRSRLWWCIQYVHHWWCQVWYWCAGDQGYDGASNMSTTGGVKYGIDVPEIKAMMVHPICPPLVVSSVVLMCQGSRLWWCIQYVHHWWCQVWYWCARDQGYDGASNMSTTGGVKCGIDVPEIKAMMVHPICPPLVVSSVVLMCQGSRLWWCIQYVHHWWCQVWYWCAGDQGYDGASNMSTTGGVKCGIDVPEIKAMMVHPICPPLVVSSMVLMCRGSRLWWCIQYVHHWWCQVWYWCAGDQGYDGASNMSTTGGVKCGIDVPEIKAMMVHPICPPLVVSSMVLMCQGSRLWWCIQYVHHWWCQVWYWCAGDQGYDGASNMSTTGGVKCGIDVLEIKAMMVHPICPPLVVSSVVLMCRRSRLWWCIQYVHHWWCQVWYWCAGDQGYDGASNMSTTGGVKCGNDVPGIKAMMVHPICPPLVVSSVVLMCQGWRLWWCIQYVHHWWCQVWCWCARDQGYDGASNMSTTGGVKYGVDVPGIKAMMVHPICPPLVVSSVVLMCKGSRLWWCIQYVHHWWCQVWYWSAGDQGYDGASNMSTTGGVKCGIEVPEIKAMMVHPICPPLVVFRLVYWHSM